MSCYWEKCNTCQRFVHFAKQCKFKQGKKQVHSTIEATHDNSRDDVPDTQQCFVQGEPDFAFQISTVSHRKQRIMLQVQLNGKDISMQLDTAADVTVI